MIHRTNGEKVVSEDEWSRVWALLKPAERSTYQTCMAIFRRCSLDFDRTGKLIYVGPGDPKSKVPGP